MADVAQADEDAVAQFVALTGSSTDQAAFMLEATHGNLEQAVQMYLGELVSDPPCPHSSPVATAHASRPTTFNPMMHALYCLLHAPSRQPAASCQATSSGTHRSHRPTTACAGSSRCRTRGSCSRSSRSSTAKAPAGWLPGPALQTCGFWHPCDGLSGAADVHPGRHDGGQGAASICHACSER